MKRRRISDSINGASVIVLLLGILGAAATIIPAVVSKEGYIVGIIISVSLILGSYIIHVVLRGFAVIVENYEKPKSEEKQKKQKDTKSTT